MCVCVVRVWDCLDGDLPKSSRGSQRLCLRLFFRLPAGSSSLCIGRFLFQLFLQQLSLLLLPVVSILEGLHHARKLLEVRVQQTLDRRGQLAAVDLGQLSDLHTKSVNHAVHSKGR